MIGGGLLVRDFIGGAAVRLVAHLREDAWVLLFIGLEGADWEALLHSLIMLLANLCRYSLLPNLLLTQVCVDNHHVLKAFNLFGLLELLLLLGGEATLDLRRLCLTNFPR